MLTELRQRGVQDIYVACMDGMKGLPEAVTAVFPKTLTQFVHRAPGAGEPALRDRQGRQGGGGGAQVHLPVSATATAEDAARELAAFEAD